MLLELLAEWEFFGCCGSCRVCCWRVRDLERELCLCVYVLLRLLCEWELLIQKAILAHQVREVWHHPVLGPLFSSFLWSGFEEVSVPDGVRELCEGCFKECWSLRRVTFGPSSSLEQIDVDWIQGTSVEEVFVPDGVCELCEGCFKWCESLRGVTFWIMAWANRRFLL